MLLSVYALSDNAFKGHIEVITSLSWTHRMQEPGDMALEVPYSAEADALLAMDNYVMLPNDTEAMIINYKSLTRDGNGAALMQVQGQSFMSLLARRRVLNDSALTYTPGKAVYELINDRICLVSPETYSSRYPNCTVNENTDITATQKYQFDLQDNLLDTVRNIIGQAGFGLKVVTTPSTPLHAFTVYSSTNRSVDGSGQPVVFSPANGTAHVTTYTESTANYANKMAFLAKRKTANTYYSGTVWRDPAQVGSLPGYQAYEAFVSMEVPTLTESVIEDQARTELQNYNKEYTVAIELNPDCHWLYGTDYNVGDIVTVRDPAFGIDMNATITEVTRTWQGSSPMTTSITLGTGTPRLERRITAAIRAGR